MVNNKRSLYPWKRFIKDYWKLLEGRRLKFVYYTFINSFSEAIPFLIAYLLGSLIDFFIGFNSGDSLSTFYYLTAAIGIAGGFQVWLRFYGKNGLKEISGNIRKETRIAVMSKIMDLELKWHDKEETGSKLQKINEGSDSIYRGFAKFADAGISILVGIFGAIFLFLVLNIYYLIFGLVFTAVYIFGENYFNKRISYWQDRLNKIKEKVSGKLHESTSNLLTVKSLGLKETFKKSTTSYEMQYFKIWRQTKNINQLKFKTIKIFSAIGYGGFIFLIGFDVVNGLISAGMILVFATYFQRLQSSLHKLTNESINFIQVRSSVGRFMTIFGIRIFDRDQDKLSISKNWKKIEFRNVTFRYKDKDVLKDFNLVINRGDKIGVVGKSGCGKSTLTKILLGLYPLKKGDILIDGIPIRKYKHSSITDTIAIVLQDSEMFNTSLLENVTISSIRNNYKTFENAIKISQLSDLIKRLPKGINTLIGEKGYHLSGGERQRVGIARAIYKNSSMILLDEATSALDTKTEKKIEEGIENNLGNKTMLIIAHRLSTLKNVDKIIVMEKGKIVEKGRYNDLLFKKGKFYKLLKEQGALKNK